jgi:phosphatidylserine decarboxylase
MKFAPEGYPFILSSFLLSGIAAVVLLWVLRHAHSPFIIFLTLCLSGLTLVLTFFMAFFFRDPDRIVPEGEGLIVSPADGKVIAIKDAFEKTYPDAEMREISIFMSPLDVHVNRAPCDGEVVVVRYSPGKFMAAYKDDASLKNENIMMVIDSGKGKVLVRQVAGFIARRAVCRAKEGDVLKRGERYGIIKFGSRLDVYMAKDAEIKVNLGDRVKAGETIIAVNPDSKQTAAESRQETHNKNQLKTINKQLETNN